MAKPMTAREIFGCILVATPIAALLLIAVIVA